MKKNTVSVILIVLVILSVLTGCTDSSKTTSIKQVDYDPAVEVKRFKLNELSEKEKNYTVQMGYNNCDHMVAALVGEYAGIYKALGLSKYNKDK